LVKPKIWYGDIMKLFCGIFIPFLKKLWAQNDDFKFQRGHMNFSGVI
jgi:hypothetical protein